MKDTKNFRSLNCTGCQCDLCIACSSPNCEICYRADYAEEDFVDMYHAVEGKKKECDFD